MNNDELGLHEVVKFRELVKTIPDSTYITHTLYAYPAKFIPHVVRYAIDKYTDEGDWVFDPFAGYGTVGIEASLMGRNAELWDLNPITRVLTYASIYRERVSSSDFEIDWEYERPFHPKLASIMYWYRPEFYTILSRAWGYWHWEVYEKSNTLKEKSKAFLVSIPLLKVSRFFSYTDEKMMKTSRTKYAEEKVKNLLKSNWRDALINMYWSTVKSVSEKIKDYLSYNPKDSKIVVKTSWKRDKLVIFDSLREKLDRDVRLMITSPPYLQAQKYIRSFEIELSWLGFSSRDIRMLEKREIPYNKPIKVEINSKTYRNYREKIRSLRHQKLLEIYDSYFDSLIQFLNNNYHRIETMTIFVGPVKIRNIRIPIDEIIKEHLETLGYTHIGTMIDKIMRRRLFRTEINPSSRLPEERTPTEHLLIMRSRK